MTAVLVVGPYPPTSDPAAQHTLAVVRALSEAGDDVEVLAPRPGAAHHHAELQGLRGALAVARRAGAHGRIELLLEPSLFNRAWVARPRRVLDRLALGAALRRWPEVVVHVDAERFPGAVGAFPSRFLWKAVDRFVVAGEGDRRMLRDVGVVPDDRIVVRSEPRPVREPSDLGWRFDGAPSRDDVMVAVRARAAEERELAAAGGWADPPAWPTPPRPGAAAGAAGGSDARPSLRSLEARLRPYGSVAKRAVRRALAR